MKKIKILAVDCSTSHTVEGKKRNGTGNVTRLHQESIEALIAEGKLYGYSVVVEEVMLWKIVGSVRHTGGFMYRHKKVDPLLEAFAKNDGVHITQPTQWFGAATDPVKMLAFLTPLDGTPALAGKPLSIVAHCDEDGAKKATMDLVSGLINMKMKLVGTSFKNRQVENGGVDNRQNTEHLLAAQNLIREIVMARIAAEHGFLPNGWNLRQ